MATYKSEWELNSRTLEIDDQVIFNFKGQKYIYTVHGSFLNNTSSANAQIFTELGMNETQKKDFCSLHYGYQCIGGDCPETKGKDMLALTRLVLALFRKIGQTQPSQTINEPSKWRAGMKVLMLCNCMDCKRDEFYTLVKDESKDIHNIFDLRAGDCVKGCACIENWKLDETEEMKMELKEIKKANMVEAAKQIAAEKINAEIAFAKDQLRNAQNQIDSYDRQIKQLEDYKKPYLDILAKFS
jgi:hypothetical protein